MAHEVRGVVALAKGAAVSLETVLVPDPGPGEALVRVQACGVCHTDLHYREGGINDDFPFLLGHEAAGVVESVGPDVDVGGRRVTSSILNWRAVCGECRSCRRGSSLVLLLHAQRDAEDDARRRHRAVSRARHRRLRREDARGRGPVHARWTRGPGRRRRGCSGCGVMAGLGAAMFTGEVGLGRLGGGVRLRRGGLRRGGGVGARRRVARSSRSTSTPRSWSWRCASGRPMPSTRRRVTRWSRSASSTGGNGADVCIEAVGNPKVMEQAFFARDLAGTLVQVGVPTPDMRIELPMIEFFGRGGRLKPSWYGDCLPSRDFPMLVDLYLQGRLDLDGFVSETITLEGVEEAFHRMERGEVLRSVVVIGG